MTNDLIYDETSVFERDFNQLKKKFKTLDDDLKVAQKNAIELFHIHKVNNNSIVIVPGYPHQSISIYKIRKFACKALKGSGARSGIRIIYAHHVENNKVTFIEIYFKADQENEDRQKIMNFLKSA
jgi:hypothetical protein